ncbi:hypothetical protein GCM10027347_21850 [Larkinella harenae]
MNLLNLALIRALVKEALATQSLAQRCAFNNPWQTTQLDALTFTQIFKASLQAQNLYERLQQIYLYCRDMATNAIQYHQEMHEWIDEEGEFPFDPFDELFHHFDDGSAYALPACIEQYEELYQLQINFSTHQQQKIHDWEQLFGKKSSHPFRHDQHPGLIAQEVAISADAPLDHEINRQIHHIEMEHCLDGYNSFYQQAKTLLETYRGTGDIQTCSRELLAFFKE